MKRWTEPDKAKILLYWQMHHTSFLVGRLRVSFQIGFLGEGKNIWKWALYIIQSTSRIFQLWVWNFASGRVFSLNITLKRCWRSQLQKMFSVSYYFLLTTVKHVVPCCYILIIWGKYIWTVFIYLCFRKLDLKIK